MEIARQDSRTQLDHFIRDDIKSIHNLNDEILEKIFGMLSLFDRMNIEKVCKHWKYVSENSWERSANQKLDLPYPRISVWTLKILLERSRSRLTHIDFSRHAGDLRDIIMFFISDNCKNIQFMDITSLKLNQSAVYYLYRIFHNITEFRFGSCVEDCEERLSILFRKNNKMKSLKIESITSDLTFLTKSDISDSLEKLILENINSNFSSLCSAAHKYKNIHTLFIKDCDNITEEIWTAITKWKNLKHVQFSGNFNKITSLNNISFLRHLESLDVSFNLLVDDNFLRCIVNGCPYLYDVNISYCDSITDVGLKVISTLPNLKKLNISYLNNVKEFSFTKMEHLEILMCCGCLNLETKHIANVLFGSLKLQYLNISYCKEIRSSIIEVIELLNAIRTSSLLKINIYCTRIIINKFKKIPKVEIIRHDENPSKISINKLNVLCLRHIISYLPLKDKVTACSVSRMWNDVTKPLLSKITDLSYSTVKERLCFDDLKKVVNCCGEQFRFVDFNICSRRNDFKNAIPMIGEKCSKIQTISITRFHLTNIEAREFSFFTRVTSFTVGNSNEWKLVILFKCMPALVQLRILNCHLWGDCLLQLISAKGESYLDWLAIAKCDSIYQSRIAYIIPKFHKLTSLFIINCTDNGRHCPPFILNSPSVRNLLLCDNNPPIIIGKLPNLRSLDVSHCRQLNDVLLNEICEKCKNLTQLNISHCTGISNAALSSLSLLKNLKHLKMNGLLHITDPKAKNLTNLNILECEGCINLYNAGLFALINTSFSLEVLDLSNCRCITHDLINHIICLRKKACPFDILTIHLGGTNVDKNALIEFMPFVRLCDSPYKGTDEKITYQRMTIVRKRPHDLE